MNGTVGLDFGTSTTLIAVSDARGIARVLPLGRRAGSPDYFVPSVARPLEYGFEVGETAASSTVGTVRSVKRSITRHRTTQAVVGGGASFDADDVIRAILREAVDRAQALEPGFLESRSLRLGCPAMWDGDQRRRLAANASAIGLDAEVRDIIDEPIAAGIGWVAEQQMTGLDVRGRVLVVDIGGGTLDVALLNVEGDGRTPSFKVLAADAQDEAGDDLDDTIAVELERALVREDHDPQSAPDPAAARALILQAARDLKVLLSTTDEAVVGVPLHGVPQLRFTRAELERLLEPMLERAERLVRSVVASGRLRERYAASAEEIRSQLDAVLRDVEYVLLTGGASKIPVVRTYFEGLFEGAKVSWTQSHDAQHAVVRGLASTESYEGLNLHRPPFDLVAVDPTGREIQLYSAFSPLYDPWQVLSGGRFFGHQAKLSNPKNAFMNMRLVCRDLSGRRIPIETVDPFNRSTTSDAIDFRLAPLEDAYVKLYVDGRLALCGKNQDNLYHMDAWPLLSSGDRGTRIVVREPRQLHDAMTYQDTGEPG